MVEVEVVVVERVLVGGCLRMESKARGAAVARRLTGLRMLGFFGFGVDGVE